MLTVSKNNRVLLKDGKYFPYLADTAWTLVQRLTREETVFYFDKRRKQGFNAVQVSAISELDGIRVPNREGQLPFYDETAAKPNSEYFSFVIFLADCCEERDMVLVLLPTWGDKFNRKWGIGPEIFTPENSFLYGSFLGSLIGKRENVIWMLGGDRPLENETHRRIIDEMARGLKSGETVEHLMTYHPCGEASSADYLRDRLYIDFHSVQSSHSFGGFDSDKMIKRTMQITGKPCLDAECFYEDFPIDFDLSWNYRFCDRDIRRRMYRNMMSGALGHTYGHQSVWCFKDKADGEYIYSWRDALDRPMAETVGNINRLSEIADLSSAVPSDFAHGALSCTGNGYAMVYVEDDNPVFIDLKNRYNVKKALWFDPVSGKTSETGAGANHMTVFSPFGHDAVLLLFFMP